MADVQPMQIDPPGSGRNLAVAPCSTAAPAHHAAVAFVEPAAPRRSPRLRRSDCYGIISHANVHDPPGSTCTPAASPPVAGPDAPADHAAAASASSAAACPVLAVAFPAASPPVANPAAPTPSSAAVSSSGGVQLIHSARSATGYKGVYSVSGGKFTARVTHQRQWVSLGVFETAVDAAVAYATHMRETSVPATPPTFGQAPAPPAGAATLGSSPSAARAVAVAVTTTATATATATATVTATATATATATVPRAAAFAGPFAGPSAVDFLAQSLPPPQEMTQHVASACECTSTGWCPQHPKPRGRKPANHTWQYVPSLGHWAYLHNETNALWDRIPRAHRRPRRRRRRRPHRRPRRLRQARHQALAAGRRRRVLSLTLSPQCTGTSPRTASR